MNQIIDISPVISDQSPVFPGDTPFSRKSILGWPKDNLALSSITTTVHVGAHTDAPIHYHSEGVAVDQLDLVDYIGDALVVDAREYKHGRIPESIVNSLPQKIPKKVLFRTESFEHQKPFKSDFASLHPKLIEILAAKGVRLIGIDTPSIDPADCKTLDSHKTVYRLNLRILEGIDLHNVESGDYELIALPLKIKNADASPVRAILRKMNQKKRF